MSPEPVCCSLKICDQQLLMLPERALYWREQRVLFVADLHLGKDATFRQAGLPVPAVSTRDSLSRLLKLIERWQPVECIILGDLIHAANSVNERIEAELTSFFEQANGCRWRLIKGNHDRHSKHWPKHWPLLIESDSYELNPFMLVHVPPSSTQESRKEKEVSSTQRHRIEQSMSSHFFLAGHIHPAWRGKSSVLVREKLPCFWRTAQGLVLPAFGTFTGTHLIEPKAGEQIYAIAEDRVIEV